MCSLNKTGVVTPAFSKAGFLWAREFSEGWTMWFIQRWYLRDLGLPTKLGKLIACAIKSCKLLMTRAKPGQCWSVCRNSARVWFSGSGTGVPVCDCPLAPARTWQRCSALYRTQLLSPWDWSLRALCHHLCQAREDGMRQLLGNKYCICKEHDSNNTTAGKPPGTEDFLATGSSLQATGAEVEDLLTHMSKGY